MKCLSTVTSLSKWSVVGYGCRSADYVLVVDQLCGRFSLFFLYLTTQAIYLITGVTAVYHIKLLLHHKCTSTFTNYTSAKKKQTRCDVFIF